MNIHPHDSLIVISVLTESDGVTIGFRPSPTHTFGPKSTEIINRKMAELKAELDAIRVPNPIHEDDADNLTQCEACNDILAECSCSLSTT